VQVPLTQSVSMMHSAQKSGVSSTQPTVHIMGAPQSDFESHVAIAA
jgi:hypothetical protein